MFLAIFKMDFFRAQLHNSAWTCAPAEAPSTPRAVSPAREAVRLARTTSRASLPLQCFDLSSNYRERAPACGRETPGSTMEKKVRIRFVRGGVVGDGSVGFRLVICTCPFRKNLHISQFDSFGAVLWVTEVWAFVLSSAVCLFRKNLNVYESCSLNQVVRSAFVMSLV
jgi:hypothetical protein